MKKNIVALFFLLTLASQCTWCAAAAERRTKIDAQEIHEAEGKKLLEIQSPRKLSLTHHKVVASTAEKHPRRMAIGHKGGSMGGGGASSVGGGGAASEARPHSNKNAAAAAAPVPMVSVLALAFSSAIVLSAFGFRSF